MNTGFGLGLPGLWAHADPFQLPLKGFLTFGFGFFLIFEPLLFLLQPGGIIAFPGDALTPVQLQNPAGDIVEKISVMGDSDDGSGIILKMVFQPGDGLGIEMVGGFVQKQNVGFLQQQPAQRHPAFFPAGQHLDQGIARRTPQRIHGHFQAGIQIPCFQMIQAFLNLSLPFDQFVHFVVGEGLGEFLIDVVVFLHQVNR